MIISELWLAVPMSAWHRLGFTSRSKDLLCLPDFGLRFTESASDPFPGTGESPSAVTGWSLVDAAMDPGSDARTSSIDGIETRLVPEPACAEAGESPLAVLGVDHVVVMTGSLERTCAAVTAVTGAEVKRIRDAGRGVRQGFHRLGPVILEVVERPDLDKDETAAIWGLVLTVADLDGAVAWLGPDVVGQPRPAVQEGRRIATVASAAGLGLAVALMSPAA